MYFKCHMDTWSTCCPHSFQTTPGFTHVRVDLSFQTAICCCDNEVDTDPNDVGQKPKVRAERAAPATTAAPYATRRWPFKELTPLLCQCSCQTSESPHMSDLMLSDSCFLGWKTIQTEHCFVAASTIKTDHPAVPQPEKNQIKNVQDQHEISSSWLLSWFLCRMTTCGIHASLARC